MSMLPSRAGSPSPATRPGRAQWRGAPRARPGGVLARVGGARGAGRRQARAPAGAEWHGVGGRGRWKRSFDFPILTSTTGYYLGSTAAINMDRLAAWLDGRPHAKTPISHFP